MNSFCHCTVLIIPILITLLQLKYQGADLSSSPFAAHPRTMYVATFSSVLYYLSYIVVEHRPPRPLDVAARISMICSGYASISSLTSLLFSASIRAYVHLIFVLISAVELWFYCKRAIDEEQIVDFKVYVIQLRPSPRPANPSTSPSAPCESSPNGGLLTAPCTSQ